VAADQISFNAGSPTMVVLLTPIQKEGSKLIPSVSSRNQSRHTIFNIFLQTLHSPQTKCWMVIFLLLFQLSLPCLILSLLGDQIVIQLANLDSISLGGGLLGGSTSSPVHIGNVNSAISNTGNGKSNSNTALMRISSLTSSLTSVLSSASSSSSPLLQTPSSLLHPHVHTSFSNPFLFANAYPYFPRLPCKHERELFEVNAEIEDVVNDFLEVYDSYADPVVEVMDAVVIHQISTISESFLSIVESLRLILCYSLCQEACSSGGADPPTTFWVDHFINKLHRNIELISPHEKWRSQVHVFYGTK
jgi:hypothetical protein